MLLAFPRMCDFPLRNWNTRVIVGEGKGFGTGRGDNNAGGIKNRDGECRTKNTLT